VIFSFLGGLVFFFFFFVCCQISYFSTKKRQKIDEIYLVRGTPNPHPDSMAKL